MDRNGVWEYRGTTGRLLCPYGIPGLRREFPFAHSRSPLLFSFQRAIYMVFFFLFFFFFFFLFFFSSAFIIVMHFGWRP